jgi:type III pantothenate kinase
MTGDLLLAIDAGNTNTVFGLYDGTEPRATWRLSTVRERTGDEYAAALVQLMNLAGIGPERVAAAVIGSVVPQVEAPLRRMCRRHFGVEARVVGLDLDVPIAVRVDHPAEVGADRLVNSFAAFRAFGQALIVVDFGTATTFDVVDAEGAYCGGVIAPGINLSLEALHRAAAKLPRIAVERPATVVGTSTLAAMQSGIYFGYVGLIDGLIARIRAEHGSPMPVVATGGLAELFAAAVPAIDRVDLDLTMRGLVRLHALATPSGPA